MPKPATKRRKVALPAVPDANAPAHPAIVRKDLRQIFRDAFDQLGGADWLVRFVRDDPQNARTFVQAIARLMPLELTGKDGAPLTVVVQSADGVQTPVRFDQQGNTDPPPLVMQAAPNVQ